MKSDLPSIQKVNLYFVKAQKEYNPKYEEWFNKAWNELLDVLTEIGKNKLNRPQLMQLESLSKELTRCKSDNFNDLEALIFQTKTFLEDCRRQGFELECKRDRK
ncbi:MAG: hypothetical protein NT129_00835 [Candidatus Aenigmarchaeota archaeon]|nr:hypothetical protein [Candidatus Aenigmarchaeota archaeon]